ncbi:hypothetical protein LIER_18715 [Lithospermum erythrorhizon]|uniref:F-box domain-containing protein n=1 Tax=Lithospermum erythrorhizon TaxID=34254 RepID=A0AAV3QHU2_LITER
MPPQPQVKKRETSITILPEEIIFNILICLPAHVLYNVMRYVCRQWRRIIEDPQFVNTHFLLATTTLLMHSPKRSRYYLLDLRECHARLSGFEFNIPSKYKYQIYTCNGLMLIFRGLVTNCTYYVGNPITRRALALPRLSFRVVCCALAFEASSEVYKVVVVYRTEKGCSMPYNLDLGCAILTVGIDNAWRFLNYALTKEDMTLLDTRPPITSTYFVYWAHPFNHYILALDLKSESIKRISPPLSFRCTQYINILNYLAKGNSISVWYVSRNFSMEVWLLKDYTSEEWVKILYIDGEPIRNQLRKVMSLDKYESSRKYAIVVPRSWYGKRILFDALFMKSHLFVYDLETCGCYQFDVEYGESFSSVPMHFVNSLTWGC